MPYTAAKKPFSKHVKSLADGTKSGNVLSTAELIGLFLQRVQENRGHRTYTGKKYHLNRIGNFNAGKRLVADMPAQKDTGATE